MTATANDRDCIDVGVTVPRYGNWRASIVLADPELLPTGAGEVVLEVSGITFRGTVDHQGVKAGHLGAELVGGFGGWDLPAPVQTTAARPTAQRADNGVKLGAFASALAADVGEQLVLSGDVDRVLGITVPRMGEQSADAVLSFACSLPSGSAVVPWWVRPVDGVTVLGARDGGEVDADASPALDSGPSDRWRSYALIDASVLLPGATVDGRTIEELAITATGDKGAQVVTLAAEDTLWSVFWRAVYKAIGPRVSATRLYRYQVIGFEADGRFRTIPRRAKLAPALPGLPLWPGCAGHRARPQVGSDILVQFADGDPGFPVVVGFQPANGVGIPTLVELAADVIRLLGTDTILTPGVEAGRFVRYGDTIMFPSGPTAIPTALPILGSAPGAITVPAPPFAVSKVTS